MAEAMNTKTPNPILVDFNSLSSRSDKGTYVPSVPVMARAGTKFVDYPGRSASEISPAGEAAPATAGSDK
jgi:hypothetical protein